MLNRLPFLSPRNRGVILLVSVWLACPLGAMGGEVHGLFEAQVAVTSKSEAERASALGTALVKVARKVSGQRNPEVNAAIAAARQHAGHYVQQFRYRAVPSRSTTGEEKERLILWAQFDPEAVSDLLRAAGVPVWGRSRPSVLVWLAVEQVAGRRLVGAGDGSGLSARLRSSAARRGLPLILPLLDLEDQSRVGVTDVWGGFREAVLRASQRYQSEAVLVGRAFRTAGKAWEVRWRLFLRDTTRDWVTGGDSAGEALEEGIHQATDVLAARFVRVGGFAASEGLEMTVVGVYTLEDYARTLGYLRSLDPVTRAYVERVDSNRVVFRLSVRGGRDDVTQSVALGRTLQRTVGGDELRYRLLP